MLVPFLPELITITVNACVMKALSVTFDTNTFRKLVGPHKRQGPKENLAFDKIESAIKNELIQPYISDAIVIIEGTPRRERQANYKSIRLNKRVVSRTTKSTSKGSINEVTISLVPQAKGNAPIPEPLAKALQKGIELGFRFLHVPRVAHGKVEATLYKTETQEELAERLKRAEVITHALEEKGFGAAHVRELSKKVLSGDPLLEKGEMLAFAEGEPKPIPDAISEWGDGDALSAHYAYGHDYFCTFDKGKNSGQASVLHAAHRSWLFDTFGISIIDPFELINLINLHT